MWLLECISDDARGRRVARVGGSIVLRAKFIKLLYVVVAVTRGELVHNHYHS